jgi:hypothetical protein
MLLLTPERGEILILQDYLRIVELVIRGNVRLIMMFEGVVTVVLRGGLNVLTRVLLMDSLLH